MLKVKNGKISGKGTAEQIIEDFMIMCVWFCQRVLIPTTKDKTEARYKMEKILYSALDNIKEAD